MAKGFLKGVLLGGSVSLGALVLISVAAGGPHGPGGQERGGSAASDAGQPVDPGARTPNAGPSALGLDRPEVAGPEPDTLAGLLAETFSPAAVPQTGDASDLGSTEVPQTSALSGIAEPRPDAPRVSFGDTASLETPATEPGLSISTDPAQPVAPPADPQATAFAPPADEPAAAETAAPAPQEQAETPPVVATDIAVPQAPDIAEETAALAPLPADEIAAGAANADESTPEGTQAAAVTPSTSGDPEAPPGPSVVPPTVDVTAPEQPAAEQTVAENAPPAAPEARAPQSGEGAELPAPATASQETSAGESASAQVTAELSVEVPDADAPQETAPLVEPAESAQPTVPDTQSLPAAADREASLTPQATETAEPPQAAAPPVTVRVNRLPTLGEEPEVPEEAPLEIISLEEIDIQPDLRPFDRFAAPFEPEEAKPLMAIVLMDDGVDLAAPTTGLAALSDLPYPVSFAVDALLPDATARMEAYRAAGFEVLATVDLPAGAQASDAEVNLAVALEVLPEVVAVLDGVRTGVQTTPDAGRQVAQVLVQTGHGLVTQNQGLNTVQKLAAREGVPSAVVFRDFDANGQPSSVIRRFLDQAAFRAGQDGSVVMLGRLREETLAALVLWALQDRASSVALAPVSAVLRAQ